MTLLCVRVCLLQGEWVWVPDEVECFLPAKVEGRGGGRVQVEYEDGTVRFSCSPAFIADGVLGVCRT